MADEVVKRPGNVRTIVFACEDDDACPAEVYFLSLPRIAQAHFFALFGHKANSLEPLRGNRDKKLHGTEFFVLVSLPGKHKRHKVAKVLWELKSNADKVRFVYFYWDCKNANEKFLVVTHGFPKKEDRINRGEIERAKRIAEAYIRRKARKGRIG